MSSHALKLGDWIAAQSKPAPPKRVLIVVRPTTSNGMQAFLTQYNRFLKTNTSSQTVHHLYRAVLRAETTKDLISRLAANIREKCGDLLSGLQLTMFAAANWMRKFCDDRTKVGEYHMVTEKSAGKKITQNLDEQVKSVVDIVDRYSASKTMKLALEAFEVRWRKEDEDLKKIAEKLNVVNIEKLRTAWEKAETTGFDHASSQKKFFFHSLITELGDSRFPLTPTQQVVVNSVKEWMKNEEDPTPSWRTDGITTLGPFGIAADIPLKITYEFPENYLQDRSPGSYTAIEPRSVLDDYEKGLNGKVIGALSPVCKITIRANDPVSTLIRIPKNASFFAFAYPVITGQLEVTRSTYTPIDAFLLYGGFVYFDSSMNVVRINSLWVGANLQLSSPKKLPKQVETVLEHSGRFRDITLPQLIEQKAKRFAWILPNEFAELNLPSGGWCYQYDDPEVNNYFAIANADSVNGTVKAVVFDFES